MRREDAKQIAVQSFGLRKVAVERNRQREIAIGHAFGFEFNQRIPQAAGFHVGRAVH